MVGCLHRTASFVSGHLAWGLSFALGWELLFRQQSETPLLASLDPPPPRVAVF